MIVDRVMRREADEALCAAARKASSALAGCVGLDGLLGRLIARSSVLLAAAVMELDSVLVVLRESREEEVYDTEAGAQAEADKRIVEDAARGGAATGGGNRGDDPRSDGGQDRR